MNFIPKDVICQQCGQSFRVTQKRDAERKYCGSVCYHAYEKAYGKPVRVEPIHFSCARCNTPFEFNPGQLRSYRNAHGKDPLYCSRQCAWLEKRVTQGKPCVVCGQPVPIQWADGVRGDYGRTKSLRNKICSSECRSAYKLAEHERRRPAETRSVQRNVTAQGYIRIRFPNKNGVKGREALEHRLVMEQMLGREMLSEETVHHRNGRRDCNEPSNLELRSGNHGPGGDVSAMVKWAHEIIALYPQFDREGRFTLVDGSAEVHQA